MAGHWGGGAWKVLECMSYEWLWVGLQQWCSQSINECRCGRLVIWCYITTLKHHFCIIFFRLCTLCVVESHPIPSHGSKRADRLQQIDLPSNWATAACTQLAPSNWAKNTALNVNAAWALLICKQKAVFSMRPFTSLSNIWNSVVIHLYGAHISVHTEGVLILLYCARRPVPLLGMYMSDFPPGERENPSHSTSSHIFHEGCFGLQRLPLLASRWAGCPLEPGA